MVESRDELRDAVDGRIDHDLILACSVADMA